MSNELEIQDTPGLPVEGDSPTPAPAPEPTPELRYEYQPTDEQGRPLGAKQVIKYRTLDELATKLTDQNTLLIRKLREETRKNRLGIMENDSIPDDAPRFQEPIEFKPRQLSPDERLKIARDLLDPERFDEASDALFEAKMGAKPELIGRTISELQDDRLRNRAKIECDAFIADNPVYVKCQENFEAITNWMVRYGLAPVRANFQKAYDKLRADKVLIETYNELPEPETLPAPAPTPEAVEAEPSPAPAAQEPVIEPAPEPKQIKRVATGLSRSSSDDTGAPRSIADEVVYEVVVNGQKRRYTGLAAINAMPSEEYKRRVMSDPTFAKKEEQLEKEARERRRVR